MTTKQVNKQVKTTKKVRTKRKPTQRSKPAYKPAYLKNKRGTQFYVGDMVALTYDAFKTHDPHPENFAGRPIRKTKIARLLHDTGDMVVLEKKLGGYWSWSVNDLRKVRQRRVS